MATQKWKFTEAFYTHDFAGLARKTGHGKTKLRLLGLAHLQEGKKYIRGEPDA